MTRGLLQRAAKPLPASASGARPTAEVCRTAGCGNGIGAPHSRGVRASRFRRHSAGSSPPVSPRLPLGESGNRQAVAPFCRWLRHRAYQDAAPLACRTRGVRQGLTHCCRRSLRQLRCLGASRPPHRAAGKMACIKASLCIGIAGFACVIPQRQNLRHCAAARKRAAAIYNKPATLPDRSVQAGRPARTLRFP